MILYFKEIIGVIAGCVAFYAYIVYIISIFKKETKPDKASWWIWSFMGLVMGGSYYFSGATTTIWVPLAEVLGPLSIAILAFWYGEGGVTDKTDLLCLIGGFLSIIIWVISKNPVLSLVVNLIIDLFAAIPTIKKSYLRPEGEDLKAWVITGLANTINLFAIETIKFAVIIYPLYLFIIDGIVIYILIIRSKKDTI